MRGLLLPLIGMMGLVPFASGQNWSAWRADDMYRGIEVRARCTGYNEFAGRFLWDVQLRNRYQKSVDVAWAAEPQRLRGAETQSDRAFAVAPGETVDGHHTAPVDCSAGLNVRVSDVRTAGNVARARGNAPAGPQIAQANPQYGQPGVAQGGAQPRPQFQGHWQSHDPEEQQKSFTFQFYGDSVTGQWSSPGFNFEISTPVPKNIHGSVSLDGPQK